MIKNKCFFYVTILSLGVALLSGCYGNNESQTTILSKDVLSESGKLNDPIYVTFKEVLDLEPEIDFTDILGVSSKRLLYRKNSQLFQLDLNSQISKNLLAFNPLAISKDLSKALFVDENNLYVYEVQKEASVLIHEDIIDFFDNQIAFIDTMGHYVSYFDNNSLTLKIIDSSNGEIQLIDLEGILNHGSYARPKAHIDGESLYIAMDSQSKLAVYQVNEDGSLIEKLLFPHKEDTILDFQVINGGKQLIFNGVYNKLSGVFLYDLTDASLTRLVSGGKTSEGEWIPSYTISPDESRIAFSLEIEEQGNHETNYYLAGISDARLINTVRIIENENLPAVIAMMAHWAPDSNNLFIKKTAQSGQSRIVEEILIYK
ncbi:hypothetical protein HYG86_09895 [Alkalicella caledoniensis]|uniref:Uncharacterized protein n=1 Tax=Alkalicella caledoniensis TaxID=2731377 RepID=A0A7G9W8P3_ALKCA|nr:hypothetical protein [Alkalicella caledoniensis]QNO15055.1 hypothetical protein HYG86_09895 [Alkalicella caledoniensis]